MAGKPNGYTLVEVAVSVALIALLAALLLPAVARARQRAGESDCISNLSQIGKAFRMYLDDYQDARPPRLHHLTPGYVTEPRIYTCPADHWLGRGGWGWSAWGRSSTPPEHWPFRLSYGYFFTIHPQDPIWQLAQAQPGRPGYVVCVLHGRPGEETDGGPSEAPYFHGRTLRLCFDGSVCAANVPGKGFHAWRLMTDQAREPGEE